MQYAWARQALCQMLKACFLQDVLNETRAVNCCRMQLSMGLNNCTFAGQLTVEATTSQFCTR
jgi:hypothetical protein